jgi:hypothetical protein
MILKIFSPENSAKIFAFFDSKQSYFFFFYGPPKVPRRRRSFGKVRPLNRPLTISPKTKLNYVKIGS